MALATFKDLAIDASHARRLGAFWASALGLRLEDCAHPEGNEFCVFAA